MRIMKNLGCSCIFLFSLLIATLVFSSCSPQAQKPLVPSYPFVCGDGICSADELASCDIDCDLNLEAKPKITTSAEVLAEMRSRIRNYTSEERIEQSNPVVMQDQDILIKSFMDYLPVTGFRVASRNNLLSLGENISKVVCTLTGLQLPQVLRAGGLRSNTFAFGPRAASYEQFLKLRSGRVVFGYEEDTELVTSYLLFEEGEPILEYELKLRGGIFKFFEGEKINFLGHEYFIESVTNTSLKLVGVSTPDTLYFRNNKEVWINDRTFSKDVLNVSVGNDYLRVIVLADKDIRILPGMGLRSYLRNPEILLTNRLDIDYEGLTSAPYYEIKFDKTGSKYKMYFTTNQNLSYELPLAYLSPLKVGGEDYKLVYKEGIDGNDYVISKKDYFIISNNKEFNGITNLLRLVSIDEDDHLILFEDPAFEKFYIYFKGEPGRNATADLIVNNVLHKVRVGRNQSIAVDLDGNGRIGGDRVPIITAGNAIIRINNQSSEEINISIITPKQLRENNNTDLEIKLRIIDGGIVVNKAGLEMFKEQNKEVMIGMTEYGALLVLKGSINDEEQSGEDLLIQHPVVQRFADVIIKAYE